jgi:hypothetical protein
MTILAVLVCSAASMAAAAEPATLPSPEAKLITDLYGKRIADAIASHNATDSIVLANEMLTGAQDQANPVNLRALLAVEAARLASTVGTKDAADVARKALALTDSLNPQPSLERQQSEVQIFRQLLSAARSNAPTECPGLAGSLVKASMVLARAQALADKADAANATLASARTDVRTANDPDLEEDLAALTKELKVLASRAARIKLAQDQLEKAQTDGDAAGIKSARQRLGLVYLLVDGDASKAGTLLAGTDYPNEPAVTALAMFLADSKRLPEGDKCGDVVDALLKTAAAAELEQAKVKIASATADLCRAFVKANPSGLAATKVRLLLAQAEDLAGQSESAKLMARIKDNYPGLGARMEFLHDGVLKFTYDFSTRKQAKDWSPRTENETWELTAGSGDCLIGKPRSHQYIQIHNRLYFKADKPLKLSFRAAGTSDLTGYLLFSQSWIGRVSCQLGANNNTVSTIRQDFDNLWSDNNVRVGRGVHRIEISWDGQSKVSYAVNGVALGTGTMARNMADAMPRGRIQVALETAGYQASFDDVVIEGAIVEDPNEPIGPAGRPVGARGGVSVPSNAVEVKIEPSSAPGPQRPE